MLTAYMMQLTDRENLLVQAVLAAAVFMYSRGNVCDEKMNLVSCPSDEKMNQGG